MISWEKQRVYLATIAKRFQRTETSRRQQWASNLLFFFLIFASQFYEQDVLELYVSSVEYVHCRTFSVVYMYYRDLMA